MKNILQISAVVAAAILVSGCSGGARPSTAGERISARGDSISEYGDAWTEGQRNTTRGQSMVDSSTSDAERARKRMEDARAVLTREEQNLRAADSARIEGQRMIADGTAQMRQAEAEYAAIRRGPSAAQ